MGSIKLTLNIEKIDLIILVGISLIFIISIIWLVAWFIKTSKQNKTLKCIDDKLVPQQCIYARRVSNIGVDNPKNVGNNKAKTKDDVIEGSKKETDVIEEIQKMMIETEKNGINKNYLEEDYNTGKSGKIYSREDIEKLIND